MASLSRMSQRDRQYFADLLGTDDLRPMYHDGNTVKTMACGCRYVWSTAPTSGITDWRRTRKCKNRLGCLHLYA